jgi:hypothetical protein
MRRKCLVSLLFTLHSSAGFSACLSTAAPGPLGARIAGAALSEHAEFGGHRINAHGHLWRSGPAESETEPLRDPASGLPDPDRPGRFAWRRVWEYWLTLARHAEGEALSRKVISVPGLLDDPASPQRPREIRLSDLFARMAEEDPEVATALREAAVRAAMNDSPWSATFISYIMDRAGMSDRQFRYSPAHWQYIQRAFAQPEGYAYRACDPRKTTPKIGDLLCYSRSSAPLKNFAAWQEAAPAPGFSAAAHCEVVVGVDLSALKIDTVGGNVIQSVAMRKLNLNEAGVLSDKHDPDAAAQGQGHGRADNLNLEYWSVLLQLK